jgi:hypothetical protein
MKLKTLKDLEKDKTKETSYLTIKNIKKEARFDYEDTSKSPTEFIGCWIEYFFNITKEDANCVEKEQ